MAKLDRWSSCKLNEAWPAGAGSSPGERWEGEQGTQTCKWGNRNNAF
jgi:hypothetical protein